MNDQNLQKTNDKALTNYVLYAEEMLEKYSQYRELVKNGNISIVEVNNAMSDYKGVNDFLIAEYERKALEYDLKKTHFDQWYGDKYIEIREEKNKESLAASKWMSKEEIKYYIISRNRYEYNEKNEELIILYREVATLRRLCDSYKRMDGIFQTLSNNHRYELKGGTLQNRMNTDYDQKYEETNIRKTRIRNN